MAAFLGYYTQSESRRQRFDRQWPAATAAIASRSALEPVGMGHGPIRVHYLGRSTARLLRPDAPGVFIDGAIDNLGGLVQAHGITGPPDASPASLVAALFRHLGTDLIQSLLGTFALTLLDLEGGEVHLVRSRFGGQGLFFGECAGGWFWASEVKALLPFVDQLEINERGLSEVLHYRWLVGERTLVSGIRQVPPGSFVTLGGPSPPKPRSYWSIPWGPEPPRESMEVWTRRTGTALDAYFERLITPRTKVAIFLSGGVDSSLLAATVARHSEDCVLVTPVWTQHPDPELPRAKRFASHLGLEHRIVGIDDDDVATSFSEVMWRMEQPPRHYNTVAWAKLAKCLEDFDSVVYGEGAGVMFGPHRLHSLARNDRLRRPLLLLPPLIRARIAQLVPDWTPRLRNLRKFIAEEMDTILLRRGMLPVPPTLGDRFRHLTGAADPSEAAIGLHLSRNLEFSEQLQQVPLYTIIPSHLEKMDRFFAPFETRVLAPFLSPEILAVAATLPREHKIRGKTSKPILRDLGERYFPREWMYEPKLGFPTPTIAWLEGVLRNRVEALLRGATASSRLFDREAVRSLRMPADYKTIWTLICIDEFVEAFLQGRAEVAASSTRRYEPNSLCRS